MVIEKDNVNFYLTYEPDYDTIPGERKMETLVADICNSAEMDFEISGDGIIDLPRIWLHNWNTDKEYLLTHKDVEDFYKGRQIILIGV